MTATTDWNNEFMRLNGIPATRMTNNENMTSYYQSIAKNGGYKLPGTTGSTTPPVTGAPQGLMTQTQTQPVGTGAGGTYTFDDQARDRYGVAPGSGTVNTVQPTQPANRYTPQTPAQQQDFQKGMGVNIVNGQYTFDAAPPPTQGGGFPPIPVGGGTGNTGGNTGGGNTGGTVGGNTGNTGGLMTQTNTVAPVGGTVGYTANQLGDPTKWNVDDNQTVAGQVRNLINENNPLQQQAATRAKQAMNQNGMLNTTMATQAGHAAMYDAALPIAQADAATYGRSAAYNADTSNQFAGKNLDASNMALNTTAGMVANTARDTAQTIAQANLTDKTAGYNAATAAKLAETNKAAAYEKSLVDIKTVAAGALNDQDLVTLKANLTKANMGQEQSIVTAQNLTTTINAIANNKDYDGPTKEAMIREAIGQANTNLALIAQATGLTGTLLQFSTEGARQLPNATNADGTPTNGYSRIAGKNGNEAPTSANFDAGVYFMTYPDVKEFYANKPGGASDAAAWEHYVKYGYREGRDAYLKPTGGGGGTGGVGGGSTGPGGAGGGGSILGRVGLGY
jgi:hypothetical protein